jgi:hypothetical protein
MMRMDNLLNPANAHQQRCPRCQSPLNTVVVHGHEQCVICKSNIFECCSGATPNTDAIRLSWLPKTVPLFVVQGSWAKWHVDGIRIRMH